jgi:hypothetical protein
MMKLLQNNANVGFGPEDGTQNILNIQPGDPGHAEPGLEPHHPHHLAADLAEAIRARSC